MASLGDQDVRTKVAALKADLPQVMEAFTQLQEASTAPGALDAKTKRLIMVGIALSQRCEACLRVHVSAALDLGATRAELLEVAGAALLMGGGPVAAVAATALVDLIGELGTG